MTILQPVSVRRFPSFRTQPLENLSHYLWTNGFLRNPALGENLLSGNLVMETGCTAGIRLRAVPPPAAAPAPYHWLPDSVRTNIFYTYSIKHTNTINTMDAHFAKVPRITKPVPYTLYRYAKWPQIQYQYQCKIAAQIHVVLFLQKRHTYNTNTNVKAPQIPAPTSGQTFVTKVPQTPYHTFCHNYHRYCLKQT